MTETRRTTTAEARHVGDAIGVDWSRFDLEQFRTGMDVEFEHGAHDPQTHVTGNDPIVTGKIALAHMKGSLTTTSAWSAWNGKPSVTGRGAALTTNLVGEHRNTLERIFSHPSSGSRVASGQGAARVGQTLNDDESFASAGGLCRRHDQDGPSGMLGDVMRDASLEQLADSP
jgi:hypothetical protein